MSILERILNLDRDLFQKINGQWTNGLFDAVLPYTRNAIVWVPLYIFFFSFMAVNFKRQGLLWILFGILTVACTDIASSWGIKEILIRTRPCRDEALIGHVRFLASYCPKSSSFTSSHAANHFAMATFIFMTLKHQLGKWTGLIFSWAFIICYAQIYVGVHFPLDIVGGAIVGMIIGYCWSRFFNHQFSLSRPEKSINDPVA